MFDPTNGFIAFDSYKLRKIRLSKLDNRYLFESSLLYECALANIYFKQISMKSVYKNETSSLKPFRELITFSFKHSLNLFKRIISQFFLLDFNAGSLELVCSLISLFSSFLYLKIFLIKTQLREVCMLLQGS